MITTNFVCFYLLYELEYDTINCLIISTLLLQVSSHWNLVAEVVQSKGVVNEGFQSDGSGLTDYGYKSGVDHSPHELYIKLDELQGGLGLRSQGKTISSQIIKY